MMSSRPSKERKRKMDALISGDNSKAHGSSDLSACPPSSKTVCMATGSAAGDEQQGNLCHEFVTLLRDLEDEGAPAVIHAHACDLEDVWHHKYPIPLSKFPAKPIKTGNKNYDAIIPELSSIGYKPLQLVSKGRSGTIVLVQDVRPGTDPRESECSPLAIKLFASKRRGTSTPPGQDDKKKSDHLDEILIHQRLQHQNVVTFLNAVSFKGRTGVVMEFCENGNLQALLYTHDARFLHEAIARRYLHQLHSAVEYMHLSGVAHRDLCLQNILLSYNNTLKVCDFSHAVLYSPGDELCRDAAGSPGYQAPEVLMKQAYDPRLLDMWALGSVLYNMLVGKMPYGRIKTEEEARVLKPLTFPPANVMVLTSAVKELLSGMLAYVPSSRFTINRVRNSEWYNLDNDKVQIGNFYLVRQPKKVSDGEREKQLKAEYEI